MVTSWSYSKYSLYKQCPLKYKFIALDRLKEPRSPALVRGIEVHDDIHKYLKGMTKELPENLKFFKLEFNRLREFFRKKTQWTMAEEGWAYNKEWQPCAWDDFSNAWLRVKIDCGYSPNNDHEIFVIDWKTGKFNPKYNLKNYLEQLELYALTVFIQVEHAQIIHPKLVFVDQDIVYPPATDPALSVTYRRCEMDGLKKKWEKKVKVMFDDMIFQPNPSPLCKYCHFRKSNGGSCPLDK